MPSKVDIANMALSRVGARTYIQDFEEPSSEAAAVKLWYDTILDQVLAAAHWSFAKRSVSLALQGSAVAPWSYEYAMPAECIMLRYLGDGTSLVPFSVGYSPDGPVVLTNEKNATATYTYRVTDLGTWNTAALQALELGLAGAFALPVVGDVARYRLFLQQANGIILDARTRDANIEPTVIGQSLPDWLAVRTSGSDPIVTNMGPNTYGPLFAIAGAE